MYIQRNKSTWDQYEEVLTNLNKFRPIWISDKFKLIVSTNLDKLGQVWASLNKIRPILVSLNQFGQV